MLNLHYIRIYVNLSNSWYLLYPLCIVLSQCKIPACDWSKSHHVAVTNTHCRPLLWQATVTVG